MRIGIFDSGIGGLTILKSIITKYPNNEYIYLGDTLNLPYGDKSVQKLTQLTHDNITFLKSKQVDIIIIACGTVSSNVYCDIKHNYGLQLIDIITPIPNYLENKGCKRVGLIATQMTIDSGTFKAKIEEMGIEVLDRACPKFVPIIENRTNDNLEQAIKEYMYDFKDLDVIIPGCTHYPLISKEIEKYTGIKVLDIGNVIADSLNIQDSIHSLELYFSEINESLITNVKNILGEVELFLL